MRVPLQNRTSCRSGAFGWARGAHGSNQSTSNSRQQNLSDRAGLGEMLGSEAEALKSGFS